MRNIASFARASTIGTTIGVSTWLMLSENLVPACEAEAKSETESLKSSHVPYTGVHRHQRNELIAILVPRVIGIAVAFLVAAIAIDVTSDDRGIVKLVHGLFLKALGLAPEVLPNTYTGSLEPLRGVGGRGEGGRGLYFLKLVLIRSLLWALKPPYPPPPSPYPPKGPYDFCRSVAKAYESSDSSRADCSAEFQAAFVPKPKPQTQTRKGSEFKVA